MLSVNIHGIFKHPRKTRSSDQLNLPFLCRSAWCVFNLTAAGQGDKYVDMYCCSASRNLYILNVDSIPPPVLAAPFMLFEELVFHITQEMCDRD